MAVWTGLEPATPCVTGMYSNQLNRKILQKNQELYQSLIFLRRCKYTAFFGTTNVSKLNR